MQLRHLALALVLSIPAFAQNTGGGSGGGAASSVQVTNVPLPVAGVDAGTVNRTLFTDTAGRLIVGTTSAVGDGLSSNGALPSGALAPWAMYPYWYNGATWDRQFYCNATATGTATASGSTQILAAVASKSYRVCAFRLSTTPAVNIGLVQGTGTNCATGTTNLTLGLLGVTNVVLEPGATAAYRAVSANAVCINLGTAQTVNYDISYANY